jgi:proline racemase
MQRIHVIDSHTGGEPTRVIVAGGPDLGSGPLTDRVERFRQKFDHIRSAVVNEPRGSDVIVGAIVVPPHEPGCATGVIFFNNVGYLGMCGHGTIGLMVTLAHLGQLRPGTHRIDTPVGVVTTELHDDGTVSVTNVPSFRQADSVQVNVPGLGVVAGDVAWGGNWFFLVRGGPAELLGEPIEVANVSRLTDLSSRIRTAVNTGGYPEVDHVELFADPPAGDADSRNFVLCPGGAYDRSPCGTGTSAKLACLAAAGELVEGETWIQESVIGSRFTGQFTWLDRAEGRIVPTVTGSAFVTAEATLLIDDRDPLRWGIR